MKKYFKIEGLDCANCANILENKILKVKGVNSCNINFITKKLILEYEDDTILEKIIKICKFFEDGVTINEF